MFIWLSASELELVQLAANHPTEVANLVNAGLHKLFFKIVFFFIEYFIG